MAKVLMVVLVHKIDKRKSMFALFYFDLGVYIDKIGIEMKNSSKNKLKKTPFNSQRKAYNILLHSWFWNIFRCCCLLT